MEQLVCPGEITFNVSGQAQCSEGWQAIAANPTAIEELINLLTFDPSVFSQLFGFCGVLFVTSYGVGYMLRQGNRI